MKDSEAVTLISRIYQSQCPLFDSEETAKEAIDDIDIFQVAPQVYYLLKSRGLLEAVPSEHRSRLKSGVDAVLFQNMLIRSEMYKLLEAFERSGIQVIVLKGIRLSERFFGHFSGRGTSDIDLLVRPEDLDKAVSLLERHEFIRYIEDDADHFHMLLNKFYANEDFPLLGSGASLEHFARTCLGHGYEQLLDGCGADFSLSIGEGAFGQGYLLLSIAFMAITTICYH